MTPNFKREEFAQPAKHGFSSVPYPWRYLPRLAALCEVLEVVRAHFGKGVKILSGYRTPEYNKAIGGARLSQHVEGRAADIRVEGVPAKDVQVAVKKLIAEGRLPAVGGVGCYPTFTHIDIRHRKFSCW